MTSFLLKMRQSDAETIIECAFKPQAVTVTEKGLLKEEHYLEIKAFFCIARMTTCVRVREHVSVRVHA